MNATICHQPHPNAIGEVVRHHVAYYFKHWNFDERFKAQVTRELSGFIDEFDEERDGFWWARCDAKFAGAVAVDGSTTSKGMARIRWFIVPEEYQGEGVGTDLFEKAMHFCREKEYAGVYLWTFAGLHRARNLYEKKGFRLTEEKKSVAWGPEIVAQKFEWTP